MNRSRPRGSQADSQFPGMFCKPARHESCGFLMTDPYEFNLALPFSERLNDRVDTIADHSKYVRAPPANHCIHEDVGGCRVTAWLGGIPLDMSLGLTHTRA